MRGIAAAQSIAQRSTVCLARQSTGASAGSRTFAITAARITFPSNSIYPKAALPSSPCSHRCFSQTAMRPKKVKKDKNAASSQAVSSSSSKKSAKAESSADGDDDDGAGGSHPSADPADPFNFADVESRWQRIELHHGDKFKELRRSINGGSSDGGSGGVDVEAIGQTKVSIKAEHLDGDAGGGAAGSDTPLSQLALVIPRAGGRVVELRMHSPAYKKAITSAVQKSSVFRGQQPQQDPNDELVLLIKIGNAAGAGGGSAASLAAEHARRVHDLANAWRTQIRKATSRRQKTHQTWKKDKTVNPDDLRRLDRDLLKGQEKRMGKVDAEEKETLRSVDKAGKR